MTKFETGQKLNDFRYANERALQAIAEHYRTLVPLLKDKGLENVAREVEAKLFAYDSRVEEMDNFMRTNLESLLALILPGNRE